MRLSWHGPGPWPKAGEYLHVDSPRVRKAYRIVDIPKGLTSNEYRPVIVESLPIGALPKDATVHLFVRDKRRR